MDIGPLEVGQKKTVNKVRNTDTKKNCSVRPNLPKKQSFLRHNLNHLFVKVSKSETTSFHYFSQISKNVDIQLRKVGEKIQLHVTSKVNRHTDRHTDRRTHIRTNRLIESIVPEG